MPQTFTLRGSVLRSWSSSAVEYTGGSFDRTCDQDHSRAVGWTRRTVEGLSGFLELKCSTWEEK